MNAYIREALERSRTRKTVPFRFTLPANNHTAGRVEVLSAFDQDDADRMLEDMPIYFKGICVGTWANHGGYAHPVDESVSQA